MIMNILAGLIAGFVGAIGIGGGSILILYLSLFLHYPQQTAQGINLLFFIPCALIGLIFHIRHKLVQFKIALPMIGFGVIGVIIGYILNSAVNEIVLKKLFGLFLLCISIVQIKQLIKVKKHH